MNVLFSHAMMCRGDGSALLRCALEAADEGHRVLIDSGAFTNAMLAKEGEAPKIRLKEYMQACRRYYHGRVWQYVAFDVVGEAMPTRANLQRMLDGGLTPMPVLTFGEEFGFISELTGVADGWVCVAGGVKSRDSWIRHRYQQAFAASDGKAKIHALGFGRWPDVFKLPIRSADSSSYSNPQRFGKLTLYSPTKGMAFIDWRSLPNRVDYQRYLSRCGITTAEMRDPATYRDSSSFIGALGIVAYLNFQRHCETRGLHYFLAVSTSQAWQAMKASGAALREDGTFDYPLWRSLMKGAKA